MILLQLDNNLDLILELLNYSYKDKGSSDLQKRLKKILQEHNIIHQNKQGQIVLTSSLRLSCEKLYQVKSENKVFLEQLISSYNKTGNNSLNFESLSPAELAAIPLKSLDEVPNDLIKCTRPLSANLTIEVTEEEALILNEVSLEQKVIVHKLHYTTTPLKNDYFGEKRFLSRSNIKKYFISPTDLELLVLKLNAEKKQTCEMPLKLNVEKIDDLDVLFVTLYNALNENSYDERKDVDYLDCSQGEVLKQLYNDILICLKARMKNGDISRYCIFVPESQKMLEDFSEVVKKYIGTEIKEESDLTIKILEMLKISGSENSFNKKRQELATYVFSKHEISLLGDEGIKVLFKTIEECFDQVLSQANKTDIPLSEAKKISQSEFMPFLFKASEMLKFVKGLEASTDNFEHLISWRLSAPEVEEIIRLGIEIYRKEREVSKHGSLGAKTVGTFKTIVTEMRPGFENLASKYFPRVFELFIPQSVKAFLSGPEFEEARDCFFGKDWKPRPVVCAQEDKKDNGPGPKK